MSAIKLPVRIESGNFLVGADHELISSLPDATPDELVAIVALMNQGYEAPKPEEALLREVEIREMAKTQYASEGSVEIDDNAPLSEGSDNGTYVLDGTKFDKEVGE